MVRCGVSPTPSTNPAKRVRACLVIGNQPALTEAAHSRDYPIEELAVITLQASALPSVKLYPGGDLQWNVVRRQLVPEAPAGIEREQFARVSIETQAGAVPAIVPKVA
jgi:hypothetical protein